MTRIVTTVYRPKRPSRKRKAAALDMPAIVAPGKGRLPKMHSAPATKEPRPLIVRTKSRRALAFDAVPDLSPEEHKRRGDAAEALFRELVRGATGDG